MENLSTNQTKLRWWAAEDWLAIWLAAAILFVLSAIVYVFGVTSNGYVNPVDHLLAKPVNWQTNPLAAFDWIPLLATIAICWSVFAAATKLSGVPLAAFSIGFLAVAALTTICLAISAQSSIKYYGLEYALWAIILGLTIANTIGVPDWVRPALRTELYIKTGLVLLGAKMLFGVLMKLGLSGIAVAWIVTPVVLVTTYWFGQRILKIQSKTLNMVISADMSVCGVSAAIASAAACRAKKEELSLAIGISMLFTVIMMIVMPSIIKATGMSEPVGGAWIGGTVDSTGAVLVAGKMVGEEAEKHAVTIKMIQNMLIGVVAFGVALYWVRVVEKGTENRNPDGWEIWRRFPKFVLGFIAASITFSLLAVYMPDGTNFVDAVVKNGSETIRDWFFALAFVSIGLESNLREHWKHLRGGKPVVLYVCGQSLNLLLTLLMAWIVFG